jgi:hypothetical protein
MAFTDNVIAVARETQLVVALETTPGTQVTATDAGLKLVLMDAAGSVEQMFRREDDPQFRNTRSRLRPISGSFDAGKWNFPTLLKTRAEAEEVTVGESDTFLTCAMGKASAASDNTTFGTTTARAYTLLPVQQGGTVYPSFTAWFKQGHTAWYISGATVDQLECSIVGNELVKTGWSGGFMRMGFCGTDTVAAGDTGTGTALIVGNASKYYIAGAGDTLFIDILDPVSFAVAAGPLQVNSIDYATNTLTLSATATRADGDLVVPHITVPAEGGTLIPLYGKFGLVKIAPFVDYASANLPAATQILNSVKFTLTNGIKYLTDIKDNTLYPSQYIVPAFREVKGEIGVYFYRNIVGFNYKALADPIPMDYIIAPAADRAATTGRIFEAHFPQVWYETPTYSGDAEKSASIPFKTVASTAYDNELTLLFL